ncbi:hypothetical protein NEAUS03_0278 [Nematocida ausubeli]|nr:hypothetical protein NEAUS03_0278 [Nematocida ausubeli]
MLLFLLTVLCIFLSICMSMYWRMKRNRKVRMPRKKAAWVLVMNMYSPVQRSVLDQLGDKYGIKLTVQENDQDTFQNNHKKFCKSIGEYTKKVPYVDIMEFVSSNKSMFPDIVILCSDKTIFKTTSPFLLYSAELLHTRKDFSEDALIRALQHYADCEIRNGK